jgi:hypothetical protein
MNTNEFSREIEFGLENLDSVYMTISRFSRQEIEERVKISALAYECLGYYNAIEHLFVRILKHLRIEIPSGQFSHRDILKTIEGLIRDKGLEIDEETIQTIENLMAFRHIATKIYGFLIDWGKLQVIVGGIERNHNRIKRFFTNLLSVIEE